MTLLRTWRNSGAHGNGNRAVPIVQRRENLPFLLPLWPLWAARVLFRVIYKTEFYDQLRIMAMAKVPFLDAMQELREQAKQSRSKALYQMLDDVARKLARGASLAGSDGGSSGKRVPSALEGWVGPAELMLLEGSGGGFDAVVTAIDRVIALQEGVGEMKGALMAALAEPVLLLVATYATTIWMAVTFETRVFEAAGGNIPLSTFTGSARQLLEAGNFGKSIWGWLAPILVLALLAVMVWRLPRGTGWFRNALDRIPFMPWGIYKSVQGAAWLQSFSMLSQSGFSHLQVLERMSSNASPWMREKLVKTAFFVKRGEKVGMALRLTKTDFPSRRVVNNLVAFGARPGFEEALQRLGEAWMKQTTKNVKGLAAALGLVAMVLSAGAILWIALGSQELIAQMTQYLQSQAGVGM